MFRVSAPPAHLSGSFSPPPVTAPSQALPYSMASQFGSTREPQPLHMAPPSTRGNRIVSPKQVASRTLDATTSAKGRVLSPRPAYSWRSRYMEPTSLSSGGLVEARLPPSRIVQTPSGSSTPTAGPGPPGHMSSRHNVGTRSFQPVLQKRDRERPGDRVVRAPPPPVSRSTSADRRRPKIVQPVRRPCRTLSPPESSRGGLGGSAVRPPQCGGEYNASSNTRGEYNASSNASSSGSGSDIHRGYREATELRELAKQRTVCRYHHDRERPPSRPRSDSPKPEQKAPEMQAPPQRLGQGPDKVETPRSPPSSKASRSSPSTVPHIGSPGSRRESPELPGLAAAECNAEARLFEAQKTDGLFEAEPLCFVGSQADFVHVDDTELPQPAPPTSVVAGSSLFSPAQPRLQQSVATASTESFQLLLHSESAEHSSVSFNLSPIKRGPKALGGAFDAACSDADRCRENAKENIENKENITNIMPQGGLSSGHLAGQSASKSTDSKVAAMTSLWEQRVEAFGSARGSGAARGRSSSAKAVLREERGRRASTSSHLRHLKRQEEKTRRCNETMQVMLKGLEALGCVDQLGFDLDASMESPKSTISECSEDSETTKIYKAQSNNISRLHRHLNQVARATQIALLGDRRYVAHQNACDPTAALARGVGLQEEALPDLAQSTASLWRPLSLDLGATEVSSVQRASEQQPPAVEVHQSKIAGSSKPPSPQPTVPTQPEEEADGPLLGGNVTAMPRKSKLLTAEESFAMERIVVEGSRQSTISDVEPAREPQPLESPREMAADFSISTDTPLVESPGGGTSISPARPSASGPEHEDPVTTEADSSMSSSLSGEHFPDTPIDGFFEADYSSIQPCEDGMDREETWLYKLEQHELRRDLQIVVPEGMGDDRKVSFTFENKQHEIVVPEGYEVNAMVPVTLTNRPFLERTAHIASRRGHSLPEFPERWSIIDNLRHSLRTDTEHSDLNSTEFKQRYQLYLMLRGRSATPLLTIIQEDEPLGATSN